MTIVSLGSSSRGFALMVMCGETRLLLDCGIGAPTFKDRCKAINLEPWVDYILVSHGHGDHVGGAASVAKFCKAKVLTTRPTLHCKPARLLHKLPRGQRELIHVNETFYLNNIEVLTFSVPHDKFNIGFRIRYNGLQLATATDAGHVNHGMRQGMEGSDALVIETNYHRPMLWDSDYPTNVKCRIDTPTGHLANQEAGSLMEWLSGRESQLKLVLGCHLGGQSNSEEHAYAALVDGWQRGSRKAAPHIDILPRTEPSKTYVIHKSRVEVQ